MLNSKILDDITARIEAAIAASPARDIQKNLKTAVTNSLSRLDLVTREDFDVQAQLLARTREKLDALEEKVKALESR
jgi:ubiquinone biosynthesis accessory factor UbiK